VITDRRQAERAGHRLVDVAAASVEGGVAGVLLREKDLPRDARAALAASLRDVTAASGSKLLVASDMALALAVGADGVHLAASDAWPDPSPDAWPDPSPDERGRARVGVGRSCHTVEELGRADELGAGWATFSPVFATSSKPGYGPPLGIAGLAAGCRATPSLPVLALGGVDIGTAGRCVAAGACGVAVMGAVMGAADPRAVVRALVAAVALPEAAGTEPATREGVAR
jgi:thiamine-phosphate diphosphorylase